MYEALQLAKYIVSKCVLENNPISNLQLQKILYYIQKDFLKRNTIAFMDVIEAWQFGPVVPTVYYHFCGFGAMPITAKYDGIDIKKEDAFYIDPIVQEKRDLYPWDLVADTHNPDGAWAQTYQNGEGNRKVIPLELIRRAG